MYWSVWSPQVPSTIGHHIRYWLTTEFKCKNNQIHTIKYSNEVTRIIMQRNYKAKILLLTHMRITKKKGYKAKITRAQNSHHEITFSRYETRKTEGYK